MNTVHAKYMSLFICKINDIQIYTSVAWQLWQIHRDNQYTIQFSQFTWWKNMDPIKEKRQYNRRNPTTSLVPISA